MEYTQEELKERERIFKIVEKVLEFITKLQEEMNASDNEIKKALEILYVDFPHIFAE